MWIKAAEVRPGNPAVVHHAFLFYMPPGQDEIRGEDPLINSIAGFAPGAPASLWPDGYARLVPAGSRLVFQMHYTPNGSEQIDKSEVGLVFAKEEEKPKEVKFEIAVNSDFRIPPGDPNYEIPAGRDFMFGKLVELALILTLFSDGLFVERELLGAIGARRPGRWCSRCRSRCACSRSAPSCVFPGPELGGGVPARRGALADRPGGHLHRGHLTEGAGEDPAHAQPRVRAQRRAGAARSSSSSSSWPRQAATPARRRSSCSARRASAR